MNLMTVKASSPQGDRQYDTTLTNDNFIVPTYVKGRMNGEDFVQFTYPTNFPAHRYTVVVEGLMTSTSQYRAVGTLGKKLRLPHVYLPSIGSGKIGVLPDDSRLPSFWAQFVRGNTYIIPDTRQSGAYTMERVGTV